MTEQDRLLMELGVATNRKLADTVTLVVGLAAQTHPEELRTALGSVFDLSAIEEYCRKTMELAKEARQQAIQARELNQQVVRQLEQLEDRFDQLNRPQPVKGVLDERTSNQKVHAPRSQGSGQVHRHP